jgi:predicted N-formylglutamate amidohydrolase
MLGSASFFAIQRPESLMTSSLPAAYNAAEPDFPTGQGIAFDYIEGDWAGGLLLICDHARNTIPDHYDNLGLPASELERHIAYDIGMEALTRRLADMLGVPAVLSTFSRLLVDPNRAEDDPTVLMRLSDGAVIPGNRNADAAEKERRLSLYHRPYHEAIAASIDHMTRVGRSPVLISLHSFTPVWRGFVRPWHAGVLWDRDARIVHPLIAALKAGGDLVVGNNEPYTGELTGDTMNRHGTCGGRSHAILEVRQDLLSDSAGIERWAERLAPIFQDLLKIEGVFDVLPAHQR